MKNIHDKPTKTKKKTFLNEHNPMKTLQIKTEML